VATHLNLPGSGHFVFRQKLLPSRLSENSWQIRFAENENGLPRNFRAARSFSTETDWMLVVQ
jgi:hypothetical protein